MASSSNVGDDAVKNAARAAYDMLEEYIGELKIMCQDFKPDGLV
jgi:hypothetical protein